MNEIPKSRGIGSIPMNDNAYVKYNPMGQPIDRPKDYDYAKQSGLDMDMMGIASLTNLNETLALRQGFGEKLWRSSKNFSILAGTTFLDGTLGTLTGLANVATGGKDGKVEFNDFIDNPFSVSMQEFVDEQREKNKLYKTKQEQNNAWYQNMGTSNFWLGQLENAGFMVGALGAGVLTGGIGSEVLGLSRLAKMTKVVNALAKAEASGDEIAIASMKKALSKLQINPMETEKIAEDIIQMGEKVKLRTAVNQVSSSVLGSMGEARIEALTNGKDFREVQIAKQKEIYGENIPQNILDGIDEQTKYYQNTVFGLNTAILSLSNYTQFKNLFTGGVKLNDNILANLVTRKGEGFAMKEMGKTEKFLRKVAAGVKNPLAEMTEEQLQYAISEGNKSYYDLENGYKGKEYVKNALESTYKGLSEAYGSAEGWENAFGGFIMGALGLPSLKKTDKGWRPTMGGGVATGIREYNNELKATSTAVAKANEYATDSNFRKLHDFITVDKNIEEQKEEGKRRDSTFLMKNADKLQLANMVAAFSDIGQIDYLKDKIKGVTNITDGVTASEWHNNASSIKERLGKYETSIADLNGELEKLMAKKQELSNMPEEQQDVTSLKEIDKAINSLSAQQEKLQQSIQKDQVRLQEVQTNPAIAPSTEDKIAEAAKQLRQLFSYKTTEEKDGKEIEVLNDAFSDLDDNTLIEKIKKTAKKQSDRIDNFKKVYDATNTRFSNFSEESRKSLFLNAIQQDDLLERGNKLLAEVKEVLIADTPVPTEKESKLREWREATDIVDFNRIMHDPEALDKINADLKAYIKNHPNKEITRKVQDLVTLADYRSFVVQQYYKMVTNKDAIENIVAKDVEDRIKSAKKERELKKAANEAVATLYKDMTSEDEDGNFISGEIRMSGKNDKNADIEKVFVFHKGEPNHLFVKGAPTPTVLDLTATESGSFIKTDEFIKQILSSREVNNGKEVYVDYSTPYGIRQTEFGDSGKPPLSKNVYDTIEYIDGERARRINIVGREEQRIVARVQSLEALIKETKEIISEEQERPVVALTEEIKGLQEEADALEAEIEAREATPTLANRKQSKEKTERVYKKWLEILQKVEDLTVEKKQRQEAISSNFQNELTNLEVLQKNLAEAKYRMQALEASAQDFINKQDEVIFKTEYEKKLQKLSNEYFEINKAVSTDDFYRLTEEQEAIVHNSTYILNKIDNDLMSLYMMRDGIRKSLQELYSKAIALNPLISNMTMDEVWNNYVVKEPTTSLTTEQREALETFVSNLFEYAPLLPKDASRTLSESMRNIIKNISKATQEQENELLNKKERVTKLIVHANNREKLARLDSFEVQLIKYKQRLEEIRSEASIEERKNEKKIFNTQTPVVDWDGTAKENIHKARFADVYGWNVTTGVDSDKFWDEDQITGETLNPVEQENRVFRWIENEAVKHETKIADLRLMTVKIDDPIYGLKGTETIYNDPKVDNKDSLKANHNEEDIRLLLVDNKGVPVRYLGGLVYSKLRTPNTKFTNGTERYSFYNEDLTQEEKDEILTAAIDENKTLRKTIQESSKNLYLTIDSVLQGMPITVKEKNAVVGTIIESEEDIDTLAILISKGKEGTIEQGDKTIKYRKGRVVIGRSMNKMADGMIAAITRKINDKEAETIFQLFKHFITVYDKTKGTAGDKLKAANELGKGAYKTTTNLKNLVHLIDPESQTSNKPIYISGGTVVIKLDEREVIINSKNIDTLKETILEYIKDKPLQINSTALTSKFKGKKGEVLPYEELSWNGTEFVTTEWSSYKHFLVSTKNPDGTTRNIDNIPLTVKLKQMQIGASDADILAGRARRFQGGAIHFNSNPSDIPGAKPKIETEETTLHNINKVIYSSKKHPEKKIIINIANTNISLEGFALKSTEGEDISKEILQRLNTLLKESEEELKTASAKDIDALLKEVSTAIIKIVTPSATLDNFNAEITKNTIRKEEKEEEPAIEKAKKEFFGDVPPVDKDDLNVFNRLHTEGETVSNIEEATNNIEELLGINIEDDSKFEVVDNLIDGIADGRVTRNGKILLSKLMAIGTEYHEAFHYISQFLITPEERKAVYDEWKVKNNKPEATDKEVEEALAEGFREKMLGIKGTEKQETWFNRIIKLIKSVLFLDRENKIDSLYNAIKEGKYKNKPKLVAKMTYAKLDSQKYESSKIMNYHFVNYLLEQGFDVLYNFKWTNKELDAAYNYAITKTIEDQKIPISTFSEKDATKTKENLLQGLKEYLQGVGVELKGTQQGLLEEYSPVEDISNSELEESADKGKNEVDSKGISNENFREAYFTSERKKLKTNLKLIISSLSKDIDFNAFSNKLQKKLADKTSLVGMLEVLKNSTDPNMQKMLAVISRARREAIDNSNFHAMAFIVSFYNQYNKHEDTYINIIANRDGTIQFTDSNTTRKAEQIREQWKTNILTTNNEYVKSVQGKATLTDKAKKFTINTQASKLNFLEHLGIKFTDKKVVLDRLREDRELAENVKRVIDAIKTKEGTINELLDKRTSDIKGWIKELVFLEESTSDEVIETQAISAKGEIIYTISLQNFASDIFNLLNENNIPDFLNNDVYTKDSILLERARKGQQITTGVANGMSKQSVEGEDTAKLTFAEYLVTELNHTLEARYTMLITGDKKTSRLIELEDHFIPIENKTEEYVIKTTVNQLYTYYKTELALIKEGRHKKDIIVEGEQYLNDLVIFKGILNKKETEESAKAKLRKYLLDAVKDNKEMFIENKVISDTTAKVTPTITKRLLDSTIVNSAAHVNYIVLAFTANNIISTIEQTKVIFGNPAYYSTKSTVSASFVEMFKRYTGAIATRKPLLNNALINNFMNMVMPRVDGKTRTTNDTVTIITYNDVNATIVKEEIADLGIYDDITETDSFSFVMDDGYRDILYKSDSWTEAMNDTWEIESKGEEADIRDGSAVLPAIKPVIWGTSDTNSLKPFFGKTAMLRLSPVLINVISEGDKYPALKKVLEQMKNLVDDDGLSRPADIAIFKSGNKIGGKIYKATNKGQPFYNEDGSIAELNYELTTTMPMQYVGIQVENEAKIDEQTARGTQEPAILVSDLAEDGIFNSNEKEVNEYFDVTNALTVEIRKRAEKELKIKYTSEGWIFEDSGKALKEILVKEATRRGDMSTNQIAALILELNRLESSSKVHLDLLVNKTKVENLLFSLIENKVINQKRNGKSMVQFPSTGMELEVRQQHGGKFGSDTLKFYDNKLEVYLPYYFEGTIKKGAEISKLDPRLIQQYGFRIPVEKDISIEIIICKGFLPKSYGNTVIVATGITTKVGSDFDFDKINIYFPNFKEIALLNTTFKESIYFKEIDKTYKDAINALPEEQYNSFIEELNKYSITSGKGFKGNLSDSDEYKSWSDVQKDLADSIKQALVNYNNFEKKNVIKTYEYIEYNKENLDNEETRIAAMENRLLELSVSIMESRPLSVRLKSTNITKLKKQARTIEKALINKGLRKAIDYKMSDLLKFNIIADLRTKFWYGKDLVGIFATFNKHHPLAQIAGLKIRRSYENSKGKRINYRIKFEGISSSSDSYSLARISDINKGEKISDILAASLSLVVDSVKHPEILEILNLNNETTDAFCFLLLAGVPVDTALAFFAQLIIREYISAITIENAKSMVMGKSKEAVLKELYTKYPTLTNVEFNYDKLIGFKKIYQQQILEDFLLYKDLGSKLSKLQGALSFDTKGFNSMATVKQQMKDLEDVKKEDLFENIDKYVDNTFLREFKNTYTHTKGYFNNLFLQTVDKVFEDKYDIFYDALTQKELSKVKREKIGKLLSTDVVASILTSTNIYNKGVEFVISDKFEYLFKGDNSVPKRLDKFKEQHPEINLFKLQELINKEGDGVDNIRMFTRKITSYEIDAMADAILDMAKIDSTLAQDLIMFALIQSGFNSNQYSFLNVLPAINSNNMFNNIINRFSFTGFNWIQFKEEFYRNNWRTEVIVPFVAYNKISNGQLKADNNKAKPYVRSMIKATNTEILFKRTYISNGVAHYVQVATPEVEGIRGKIWGQYDVNKVVVPTKAVPEEGTKQERQYTPEDITTLKPNEIFVFGSNEGSSKGGPQTHGKGAALLAKQKFGAKQGQSEGLQGQSYAIVTKKYWDVEQSSTLPEIEKGLQKMLLFAKNNPNKKFLVTKLGSSLAGYSVEKIKKLFENLKNIIPDNVILPKEYEVRPSSILSNKTGGTKQDDNTVFINKMKDMYNNLSSPVKAVLNERLSNSIAKITNVNEFAANIQVLLNKGIKSITIEKRINKCYVI